jgi:hypothetical protein
VRPGKETLRPRGPLVVDACAATPAGNVTPARKKVLDRLHEFHASPQDCVDMAAEARVARVVLTHHLPEASLEFSAEGYPGEVIVGNDLDVIDAVGAGWRADCARRRGLGRRATASSGRVLLPPTS